MYEKDRDLKIYRGHEFGANHTYISNIKERFIILVRRYRYYTCNMFILTICMIFSLEVSEICQNI